MTMKQVYSRIDDNISKAIINDDGIDYAKLHYLP